MAAPVTVTLRPGVTFTPEAAASCVRVESALGYPIAWNSTYRDYNLQLSMWRAWQAFAAGTGPYPGHSRALHPDASFHCKALAGDTNYWTRPGFIGLMADYGWIRTAASDPTEQHHFEYQIWRDNHRNEPADLGSASFPTSTSIPTEDDMAYPIWVNKTHRFLVGPGFVKHFDSVANSDLTKNIVTADDKWIELGTDAFLGQLDSFGIPRWYVDHVNGGVLDVTVGKTVKGGMWSWAREAANTSTGVAKAISALSVVTPPKA